MERTGSWRDRHKESQASLWYKAFQSTTRQISKLQLLILSVFNSPLGETFLFKFWIQIPLKFSPCVIRMKKRVGRPDVEGGTHTLISVYVGGRTSKSSWGAQLEEAAAMLVLPYSVCKPEAQHSEQVSPRKVLYTHYLFSPHNSMKS